MLRRRFHCQKGFYVILFLYKIFHGHLMFYGGGGFSQPLPSDEGTSEPIGTLLNLTTTASQKRAAVARRVRISRLTDFVYHSTLGLRVMKKQTKTQWTCMNFLNNARRSYHRLALTARRTAAARERLRGPGPGRARFGGTHKMPTR